VSGILVVAVMVLMGGDLQHVRQRASRSIIIFGGSIAATMIRFPLQRDPARPALGAKFAFTMSRLSARDLVDELARIAEIARSRDRSAWKRSKPTNRSLPREFATSPTVTIWNSSATTSNATATIF